MSTKNEQNILFSMKEARIRFSDFIKLFPVVDLPITLTNESHHDFSKHNPPLPTAFSEAFLKSIDQEGVDEFTEYLACFRLPKTEKFHAVVYWKASLLNYNYTLVTYDKKGNLIEKKKIAGTNVSGNKLVQSVATIDEEWTIFIAGGAGDFDEKSYNPSNTQSFTLQLLPTGEFAELN